MAHALRRAKVRAWREGARYLSLGLGKSPEDIAGDVIVKVFTGERTWDPERGDLVPTLKRHVESELDHLWKRHARRREQPDPEDPRQRERQEVEAVEVDPSISGPADPEAHFVSREEALTPSDRVSGVFAAVEGDADLQEVIDAIMGGCEPQPRYLAEHLRVEVREVNNRLRRLRRRVIEQVDES